MRGDCIMDIPFGIPIVSLAFARFASATESRNGCGASVILSSASMKAMRPSMRRPRCLAHHHLHHAHHRHTRGSVHQSHHLAMANREFDREQLALNGKRAANASAPSAFAFLEPVVSLVRLAASCWSAQARRYSLLLAFSGWSHRVLDHVRP